LFAVYLLLPDELLKEAQSHNYTLSQVASIAGIPENVMQWVIKSGFLVSI